MFWFMNQNPATEEHRVETPMAQPPGMQRDAERAPSVEFTGRVIAFAQAMWFPILLSIIGWGSGGLVGGSAAETISSFISDKGLSGGDYASYAAFLLLDVCLGGVGLALALHQVMPKFRWKHTFMLVGTWVVSAVIGWGIAVERPDLSTASVALIGALGGLGLGLILRRIEPKFQGRQIAVVAIAWAIAPFIKSPTSASGPVELLMLGGVVGLIGGVATFWMLSQVRSAKDR
jgi:hypothetical protein